MDNNEIMFGAILLVVILSILLSIWRDNRVWRSVFPIFKNMFEGEETKVTHCKEGGSVEEVVCRRRLSGRKELWRISADNTSVVLFEVVWKDEIASGRPPKHIFYVAFLAKFGRKGMYPINFKKVHESDFCQKFDSRMKGKTLYCRFGSRYDHKRPRYRIEVTAQGIGEIQKIGSSQISFEPLTVRAN